ncbi:hypothetical protein J7J13_00695 [bacterium]|nr:hypothetical protein [bacterium]
MKICILTYHKSVHPVKRLKEEGEKRNHDIYVMEWEDMIFNNNYKKRNYLGDKKKDLKEFDAIIPRSDRYRIEINGRKVSRNLNTIFRLIIQYIEGSKTFFLNSRYFSEYQSLDKISQQFFFAQNKISGIDTYFFTSPEKLPKLTQKKVLKFPIIAKMAEGSVGKSVYKLENKNSLRKFLIDREENDSLFLFQRYYKIKSDFRVLVVGNKSLGVIERIAQKGEWKTNISLGGKPKSFIDDKMAGLAEKVSRKMKLDYVGVDILKDGEKYRVIETNSLPQFKGFEEANHDVNVAKELIKLVEKRYRSEF